ncbi:VOC family protein [Psychroserpens sp.]|uniref:VOC family protein n=1 Tax=Psychroserpens sp. TaxID=2020870 RepID=UPI001B016A44|nr:VOC family protein [Psychroserpens sp.]MBO6606692.1 VOC family protein [Psychroserpens sp.]MBO6631411.1 VOC family protein [Psychroserpens sp.]MBO6653396.1 VOC family protein [Psychroserpens sp.]MBO6680577.1 VOC family protein [Psychroserpens sp.]MBO6750465.1 VOC family protein [Psychroserpens sp.]
MQITTFLTFVGDQCGKATEAIKFYTSLFPNSEIKNIINYAEGEPGGTPELIKHGTFTLNGIDYMVSESNYNHAWSFSPGVSLFISDNSETLIQSLFDKLSSNGGQVMVPLDDYKGEGDYGFGKKFGWCADKYGISWQFLLSE